MRFLVEKKKTFKVFIQRHFLFFANIEKFWQQHSAQMLQSQKLRRKYCKLFWFKSVKHRISNIVFVD